MTNLNIAKLYLANNSTATAAQIDTAVTDGTALTAINALTTAQFVEAAYQAAFGRAADAEGLAYWSDKIDNQGMTADDAFMTALNYGATVYVAPTAENPLVIGTETFTAATVSATDDVVVAAAKATAEAAASSASVGSVAVAVVDVVDTTTATAAAVVIDAADAVADAAAAAAAPTAYTLALTADAVESGAGNDTITATSTGTAATETLDVNDVIVDASTTDADIMNIAWTGGATKATTIQNIETINVNIDAFAGTTTTVNATNITGATINLASTKLGYDGAAGVTALGANTVVAGNAVTTLTVAGLTTGTVDAGSATTVAMTGAVGVANTLVANGNITSLTNTTSTKTTIDATADSIITYNPGSAGAWTIAGDKSVTLKMAVADVIAGSSIVDTTTAGTNTLQVTDTAAFNSTNFDVDNIQLSVAGNTATVASGQTLTTGATETTLTILTTAATATTATLNLGHNVGTKLDVKDALLDTTINITDNVTIAALDASGEDVTVTGAKNLIVTTSKATTFDASALSANLAYTDDGTEASATISGGTASNTITVAAASTMSYIGGAGVDTVDGRAILTGTFAADTGAGNDILQLDVLGASVIAIDGGSGTDILKLGSAAGTTADTDAATTWAVNNVEILQVQKTADLGADTNTLAMNSSQLGGQTYSVTTEEAIDTVALTLTLDAASNNVVDLSGITMEAGDTVTMAGTATTGATVQVVTGTNVADNFNSSTGLHTFTGGAGDNIYTFAADASTSALITNITDFKAAAAAGDNDKLVFATAGVVLTSADSVDSIEVTGNSNATIAAILDGSTAAVNMVITDTGMLSLSGLAADVAKVDTLAEMITIADFATSTAAAETIAFEFGNNTYVYNSDVASGAAENIVELTGLTTATGVALAAAADTIFIA